MHLLFFLLAAAAQPVFDPASIDRSIDPCSDFHAYACGGWMKANPIPADHARYDAYSKRQEQNLAALRTILEAETKGQLRDFYAACMDEAAIEKAGSKPLSPWLVRIAALEKMDARVLALLVADLHKSTTSDALFGFSRQQDFRDASRWVGSLDQDGLGLPEREYYLKTDTRAKTLRAKYLEHVEKMLRLAGDEAAKEHAAAVLRFETKLAKASLPNVDRTDSKKLDHWMSLAEVQKLAPAFAWDVYFQAMDAKLDGALNVMTPAFFKTVSAAVSGEPPAVWRAYFTWHLVLAAADALSKPFVDESFAFYGQTLRGMKELEPRWKRCVQMSDALLGELLGRAFVDKHFSADAKTKTQEMVRRISAAMEQRLDALAWMTPATRKKAKEKLVAMQNNIGYPDKWRDYSAVSVKPDDFIGNVERLAGFERARQRAKIGHAVERGEWAMTPPTVNAYYDAQMNEMNFPAGVLLPPLFDARGDAAANYGNTGATVGHELTHGFDSDGRQFDSRGNLRDWWSKEDERGFLARAQCVVDQYKQYVVIDDAHINSQLTLGEDIADLGGTIIAYEAYMASDDAKARDGEWSAEQRFFIANGQSLCANVRDEEARLRVATDVHSPAKFRVNGVVANMPEFATAFACKPNAPLVRRAVCKIW